MGLGFPANAESKAVPFFINLAEQKKLASNVFSFYMTRGGTKGSELCIGCTNSKKYTGDIDYYPLDPSATKDVQLYWNILSAGVSYNGAAPTTKLNAIIDSGTTLIYLPTESAKALYAQIPGSAAAPEDVGKGFWTIPCASMDKVGSVAFVFGEKSYAINPADFNAGVMKEGSDLCVGSIVADDPSDGLAILGDAFMKGWYSVFDYGSKKVGFAKAV
ncbi:hypothetical protein FRB99_003815 [Tulasnella sp. 403]|nr:hypothetical protein FRB99_003815 [Tulasnella sp. 403]